MKPAPPLYSVHDEDASMRDAIERFVIGLAERIDELQEAEMHDDLPRIAMHCEELASEAGRAGYPALVDLARAVRVACQSSDAQDVRKGIIELTELSQRVRRGSRGAA